MFCSVFYACITFGFVQLQRLSIHMKYRYLNHRKTGCSVLQFTFNQCVYCEVGFPVFFQKHNCKFHQLSRWLLFSLFKFEYFNKYFSVSSTTTRYNLVISAIPFTHKTKIIMLLYWVTC